MYISVHNIVNTITIAKLLVLLIEMRSLQEGGVGGVLAKVDYSYLTPSVINLQGNNTENQHLQHMMTDLTYR